MSTADTTWVIRLPVGELIWLVKEQELAYVYERWAITLSASIGRIGIRRASGRIEYWYISSDGHGFDGSALIVRVPATTWAHGIDMAARMNSLEARIERLERIVLPASQASAVIADMLAATDSAIIQAFRDNAPAERSIGDAILDGVAGQQRALRRIRIPG